MSEAFIGDDPLLHEHLLTPYSAAQRYEYDVSQLATNEYLVRNPTKGTSYTITLSANFDDDCECSVFESGAGTCIHIEHARIKLGLPSTAQALSDAAEFVYAWFDKASLPPRIRLGWQGPLERQVRDVCRNRSFITSLKDLDELRELFAANGIPFYALSSAKTAFVTEPAARTDDALARQIDQDGRAWLARRFPMMYPYQIEGALFLASAQRALLLDEMGLGKTLQAIAGACLLEEFAGVTSCLVVVPKSVLENWSREISRFTGKSSIIIAGTPKQRTILYSADAFFKIVTLESLKRDFTRIGSHDLVIVDEVHKARTQATKASRVLRVLETRFFFGLSGTAIESSLADLYGILKLLRPAELESPLAFAASHLVCDDFGKVRYTINPEFFYIRHARRILRRRKSDATVTLPAIRVEDVDLPLTPVQEAMARPLLGELELLKERLKQRHDREDFIRHRWLINRIVELSNSSAMLEPDTHASSKLDWLRQFLGKKCLDEGEKVVVFTRWRRSQRFIVEVCHSLGVKVVVLSGETSLDAREGVIRQFSSERGPIAFVSTDAGGVGINLQAARTIVLFEPSWNPSTDAQRIQRVHRIGQTRDVLAVCPVTWLDRFFTRNTHGRKSFAADRIDVTAMVSRREINPTWEELVAVIRFLQSRDQKSPLP